MGGRIIKNILYIFCGKEKAVTITHVISNINAILLTILVTYICIIFKNFSYSFATIYIWIITIRENKRYKIKRKIYKILQNYIEINSN